MPLLSAADGANAVSSEPVTLNISESAKGTVKVGKFSFREGDFLSLNGTRGYVYAGEVATMDSSENPRFQKFMALAD